MSCWLIQGWTCFHPYVHPPQGIKRLRRWEETLIISRLVADFIILTVLILLILIVPYHNSSQYSCKITSQLSTIKWANLICFTLCRSMFYTLNDLKGESLSWGRDTEYFSTYKLFPSGTKQPFSQELLPPGNIYSVNQRKLPARAQYIPILSGVLLRPCFGQFYVLQLCHNHKSSRLAYSAVLIYLLVCVYVLFPNILLWPGTSSCLKCSRGAERVVIF